MQYFQCVWRLLFLNEYGAQIQASIDLVQLASVCRARGDGIRNQYDSGARIDPTGIQFSSFR